jgi:ABC-type glutathione transport system ATPase component
MSETVLRVSSVSKSFERRHFLRSAPTLSAVEGVSFSVARGETLGIAGESGSGKSTLLRMMLRLARPTAGVIELEGGDIWKLDRSELRKFRRRVQPVFQNPASSFNPRQTIGAILAAPLEVHGVGTRREHRHLVGAMLERVGLPSDYAQRLPHQLSGGEKQRVAIARATILKPAVLLADEPTSALDVSVQSQILKLLDEVRRDIGLTTVFVSHDLAVVRQISDRVAIMRAGQIVELGTADEVFERPQHDYTRALIASVPSALWRRPSGNGAG